MEYVILETNFILMNIFVMMTVFWFVTMSEVKMGSHKKSYGFGVLLLICAYISRMFCVYVDYHSSRLSVDSISLAHMVYLSCLMIAYASYGHLNLCIFNYNVRWKKIQLYLYFAPCGIAVLLIIISRFTGWVYRVTQANGYMHGPIHLIVSIIPVYYVIPGLYIILKKRKFLPTNLINCCISTFAFFLIGLACSAIFNSKPVLFAVITLILIIQLYAILFYESFWDEQSTILNTKAFDVYIKRYLEKKKTMDLYLVQIVGYGYYKETKEKEIMTSLLRGVADDLKALVFVNTIYYLGNGAYVVAIDEDEKKVNKEEFLKNLVDYCNYPVSPSVKQMSPDMDISHIRVPEDIDDPKVLYSFISMDKKMLEVREEKVRFYEKDNLQLVSAHRIDKVLKCIQNAIFEKSFQMYYQPIYSVKEKKVTSAEALIRLFDDEMGFIPPDEFIPLAEKNGMIMDVGAWVFESVCRFLQESDVLQRGIEYIEINVSLGQFLDESLSEKLEKVLNQYDVSFDQVNLEITETAIPFEEHMMRTQLKRMSEKGFQFSLDDYGTGYSNMEAVTEYPLKMIKLDKSIVWSAFKNSKAMVTMESLVSMFHSLGFQIIAEGVETKEMVEHLEKIAVDYLQGYYFSKPLPEADFLAYLENVQLKSDQ